NVVSYLPIGPRSSSLSFFHDSPLLTALVGTAHHVGSAILVRASLLMIVSSSVLMAGLVSERLLIKSSRPSILLTFSSGVMKNVCFWTCLTSWPMTFMFCVVTVSTSWKNAPAFSSNALNLSSSPLPVSPFLGSSFLVSSFLGSSFFSCFLSLSLSPAYDGSWV